MQANQKVLAGWRFELLDNLAKRGSGHTPDKTKTEYWNGGIKWISLADSSQLDNGYIYATDKEISAEGLKNSSAVLHLAETVVLSRDAGVGKSAVMAEPMAVSQHFMAWQCDNQHTLSSWFLYYWLQMMKPEFERQAVGSTIKTIGLPYFKKLRVLAPSYPEQTKIAQMLSTWDQAIATTERLFANRQQQKQALMQQLLTGQKRFAGLHGNWQTSDFSSLFLVKNDKKTQTISSNYLEQGKTPVVDQGQALIAGYTDSDQVYRDVPVIVFGDHTRAIKWVDFEFSPGADGTQILKASDLLEARFAYYLLCNADIPNLGYSRHMRELKEIEFRYPTDKAEQQKIAQVLATADAEITNLQAQLAKLRLEKKALMQQLLTGQRRVRLDAEAAA